MLRWSELGESFRIAVEALRLNLMRSILTTAGVVVGVVLVVVMGWTIKGLDAVWEQTISIIGRDMLYIDKWNWAGGGNWRNMEARRNITLRQATLLKDRMESAEVVIPLARRWSSTVQYGSKSVSCSVQGTTYEYGSTPAGTTEIGRWYSESEDLQGDRVVVLGYGVARAVFEDSNPTDAIVKIAGYPFRVIGVVEKRGFIFMDFIDNQVFIPLRTFQGVYGFYDR
ncbi:MAG: ABC transporter permease, partial [Candidatus Kapaibacteriota bacterium]